MELAWRSEQNHSVEFVPALRRLLDQADTSLDQVEAVFVARGPGGFSALRVGISIAKALAMAQSIPLVGVGSLDVEAQPYLGLGMPVCAVIEAGRTKVYAAMYAAQADAGGDPPPEYRVETHEGLASWVQEGTLICGEGARTVAGAVRERLGSGSPVMATPPPTRRPAVLAQLGFRRLKASDADDAELLQPLYMRGSQFDTAQRTHGVG